jgi:serine/threonine protein kinase
LQGIGMVGKTISHYRIVRQLGAGGMGVVYAANDPRLNRQVALKFVPDELSHDLHTLDRLRSEARTASALNHPNICTIYDIGEHEGRPYIVMELLNGQTLRERMLVRPLKIHEAVDIAIQVADALVWAHGKDVIHRDIKPANLFLVEHGPVKILDFGLAKFVVPPQNADTLAPTVDLTAVGVALGTVAYMSPEQVSGEPLDRRTDLFSLGVVLYECVTGQQPFQGKTSAVVLASILTQQPTPPMALNANVPPGLQDVIQNCLEKDRELRFQDAAGLRADLKRVRRDIESGALGVVRGASAAIPTAQRPSSGSVPVATPSQADATVAASGAAATPSRRARSIGIAIAALAVAAIATAVMLTRTPSSQPTSPSAPGPPPQASAPAPESAAPSPTPPPAATSPSPPDNGARRRDEERATRARFDAAVVDANRLMASGDAQGATRALNVAREIDPASPLVADLSARIVEHSKTESARRAAAEAARSQPPGRRPAPEPAAPRAPQSEPPPAPTSSPAQAAPAAPADVDVSPTPPPSAPAAVARPPAPEPAHAPSPPPRAEAPERRPAPAAAPPADDDDASIRKVIATYARAIETKDLALYRSVKPNLSASEQRIIEEGFRGVTSQRVAVTIQSIEHRGQDALVRLRRHDVIQAGGRQQTADSQQTMTLTRGASGWVIREIGR